MKTLMILVVSSEDGYRRAIKDVMDVVGHDVYGARTLNQAAAFIEQYGQSLDAIIVDYDSVKIDMEESRRMAPKAQLILQSASFRNNLMLSNGDDKNVVAVSKRVEISEIENHLQLFVGIEQFDQAVA